MTRRRNDRKRLPVPRKQDDPAGPVLYDCLTLLSSKEMKMMSKKKSATDAAAADDGEVKNETDAATAAVGKMGGCFVLGGR